MKKIILSLLVALMATTGAMADNLFLEISGTTATMKYGSPGENDPFYRKKNAQNNWSATDFKSTLTTVTVDASCSSHSETSLCFLFANFTSLTTINGIENLKTTGITDMYGMFYNCAAMVTLDLSSFNTASVTQMYRMFMDCSNLATIYVGDDWSTTNATGNEMFTGCTSGNDNVTYAHYGEGGYLTYKAPTPVVPTNPTVSGLDLTWDISTNSGTFTMPAYDVEIITEYWPEYAMSISKWSDTDVSDGWYLIAAPVGTTSVSDIINLIGSTTTDYDLFRFNQAAELEWENYNDDEHGSHYQFDLEPGRGYLYANAANVTLTFFDMSEENTYDITLSKTTDNPDTYMRGWNLIGNPFGTAATLKDSDNNAKDFYRMNDAHTEILVSSGTGDINAMEGIFVQATENNEVVTFTKSSGAKRATDSNNQIVVNLSHESGTVIDRAIVRFGEGEALPKFQLRDNSTKVYVPQDGKDYAIANVGRDGMHAVSTNEVPINFEAKEDGTYTLSVNPENVEMNYLHLIDNMTGADVDLVPLCKGGQGDYTFQAKTTDYATRFKLVFSINGEDGPSTSSGTFAFISNGNIIITGTGGDAEDCD